jgi:hypothetical protein
MHLLVPAILLAFQNISISKNCRTHSYILHNEERQEGFPCNSNYSLKHVLIECVDVSDVRQTFYNVNSLTDVFTNVDTIISFRKTDIYNKL